MIAVASSASPVAMQAHGRLHRAPRIHALVQAAGEARAWWRKVWRLARAASKNGRGAVGYGGDSAELEAAIEHVWSRAEGDPLEVRSRVSESTGHTMIFRLGWLDGERVLAVASDRGAP